MCPLTHNEIQLKMGPLLIAIIRIQNSLTQALFAMTDPPRKTKEQKIRYQVSDLSLLSLQVLILQFCLFHSSSNLTQFFHFYYLFAYLHETVNWEVPIAQKEY